MKAATRAFRSTRDWRRHLAALLPLVTRRGLMLSLLVASSLGMVARAAYLQIFHKDFLQSRGSFVQVVDVPAHRGMILDRNREPLAVSSPVDSIWADPQEFNEARDAWPKLASMLEITLADLEQKVAGRGRFAWLRRQMAPNAAQAVLDLKIPGVYARREYRRYYPDAEVTSHLLGFTNIDDIGQEGLERSFDAELRGIPGKRRVIRDRLGRAVNEVENMRAPQPGQEIVLSIDRRLQYLAYRALKEAVLKHRASAGAAVILDARTGEVLAMVSQPAGNPNNRSELQGDLLRNRAMTDVYEPGSTAKPFIAALGLESGKWGPKTRVSTTPLTLGRYTVRDDHNYGTLDVTHIISKSSNVGVTKIAFSLPAERLWRLYKDMGFGALTGVATWPGEQPGVLRHFKKWDPITHANHAFGYGFSVSILQLAQAYAVLAADGVRRPLTLLKREKPLEPSDERRVMAAGAAQKVRPMMEEVVTRQGTGLKASIPGYQVAGKTGTARKVVGGRYTQRHVSLFAGMVPASDPRLVMAVLIDEPKAGGYYGGAVAAPVFSAAMSGALRILNIVPDDLPNLRLVGK